jgi:hypothetical protein
MTQIDDAFAPTPPRERHSDVMAVRLRGSGRDWVDERVEEYSITKTELVKAALAFAAANPAEFEKLIMKRKEQF